jgi:hypothetical protein
VKRKRQERMRWERVWEDIEHDYKRDLSEFDVLFGRTKIEKITIVI